MSRWGQSPHSIEEWHEAARFYERRARARRETPPRRWGFGWKFWAAFLVFDGLVLAAITVAALST